MAIKCEFVSSSSFEFPIHNETSIVAFWRYPPTESWIILDWHDFSEHLWWREEKAQ